MVLTSLHPAVVAGFLLQSTRGDDIATRVDVFEEIYLFFLALGTLVGVVVVSYMLHKAYKYRAGSGREYDIDRPQLGELPTGADKGGRKLFLSFGLSAIIVISLVGWTYGWLLYVETGAAEVPEDGLEVDVVGEDFAWQFEYRSQERLSPDQLDRHVEELGEDATLEALQEAEGDPDVTIEQALAEQYNEQSEDDHHEVSEDEVQIGATTIGQFRVPVDREVYIYVTSGDVWHNFGIPEFRVKSDAIPDETTRTWFVAEEEGEYTAECFELCGSGHSQMQATVIAMPQDEFQSWYQEQTIPIDEAIDQLESGEFGSEDGGQTDESAAATGVVGA